MSSRYFDLKRAVRATAVLAGALLPTLASAASTTTFNYAEALQKSIYFYDAEKSGPGITGGHLEWRGDSETRDGAVPLKPMAADNTGTNLSQSFITANKAVLDPTGKGTVDLSGGFHDAGDHVKFGLPQAYAASTLGWGFYEFRDSFVKTGQEAHMLEELKWFSDYFLRSTFRDSSGNVVAFAYQVGEGAVDHTVWAPPELLSLPRPAYFASSETPASDQAAGAAAALALMYLNDKSTDAAYAAKCLDAAQALYKFAVKYRGLGYSGGFYGSSDDNDELSWAAVWLYTATQQQSYIDDIASSDSSGKYTGWMSKVIKSKQDTWQNIWVQSWDTVWGGVFIQLANLFPDNTLYDYFARWNLEYWSGGAIKHQESNDGNYIAYTPGGFAVVATWGSARYNAAAQVSALIYGKHVNQTKYAAWAKTQMDYIMGNNPMKYSYIVGFPSPDAAAKHPHHRAAHGSTTNSMSDPPNHKHILWGALVGGPDAGDKHTDLATDFVGNEVAIDYNAGLVGALAGLYSAYGSGQQPLASFPPLEATETAYYVDGKIEQENNQRTQVTLTLHALPTHPPHFVDGVKMRYFFNISEMIAAGQDISAVSTAVYYDEQATGYTGGAAKMVGPKAWDATNGIYYVEFDYSGLQIYGKRDLQFGLIAAQDSTWKSNWDPSNDWSHKGLTSTASATTQYAPVYLNGVLVFGQEPPCSGTGCSAGGGGGGGPGGGGGGGASYVVTVAKSGVGSGSVSSSPTGISCGTTCSASFSSGASVILTAVPASGSVFTGWSGACTGTSTCSLAMNAAKSVTATFGVAADTVPPSTPTGLSASSVTSTTAVLSWSPSTDNVAVVAYDIYYGSTLAGTSASNGATIQNLLPANTYTFTVKARDAVGNVSSASAAVVLTTLPSQDLTPPSAPANLLWASVGGTVTLSWTASSDDVGVAAYELYFGSFYLGSFDGTSLALIGFKTGTPYTFTVKARDAAGNVSVASNQATVLLAIEQDTTPPSAPTNLVASNVASTSLTLRWTASTDNVGVVMYQVFSGSTQVATTFGSTSATISGLIANTTYSFTIQALDAASNVSSASTALSVRTAAQ